MDYQSETLKTFDSRANSYETHTNWVTTKECLEPFLKPLFGNGRAFDACAGTGVISKALAKQNWKVISLDINKEMLKQHNLDFPIIGDIHNIPTIDHHFDLVICRQGLQYADLTVAINELLRICSDTIILGHITLEEGDCSNFWNEYFRIASPGRKHIFEPNQLNSICRKQGLHVFNQKTFRQKDFYNGPLIHLPEEKKNQLKEMLISQDPLFHRLYNVDFSNVEEITYTNRWEIIEIKV